MAMRLIPDKTKWFTIFPSLAAAESRIGEGEIITIFLKALEKRVALGRKNGVWYAFDDYCPHKGASMAKGFFNEAGHVVCPLHNYCYNLQHGQEEAGFGGPDLPIFFVRITDEGQGSLQIGIY